MKLRIQDNSIRIRLTQSEVARLAEGKRVEQATTFSAVSKMVSAVEPMLQAKGPSAVFDKERLTVYLPSQKVREWARSEQVGIEMEQEIDRGRTLLILVEKDFECLHAKNEENADAFPHPRR